jgi:hypothetical protein
MVCPLCKARKAKRACPALGRHICAVCCGTKRQAEIACPPDCGYLTTARVHPPAAVSRQRERDFRFAFPTVHRLPERAYDLLMALQAIVKRYRATAIPPLVDAEVAEAAAALASTLETATRGIIYEHHPTSLGAQRLAQELKSALTYLGQNGRPGLERDAALALRRIEEAVGRAPTAFEGSSTGYLDFLDRLPSPDLPPPGDTARAEDANSARATSPGPRIILP